MDNNSKKDLGQMTFQEKLDEIRKISEENRKLRERITENARTAESLRERRRRMKDEQLHFVKSSEEDCYQDPDEWYEDEEENFDDSGADDFGQPPAEDKPDIETQGRAAEEFRSGRLIAARDAAYPLDDIASKRNNNVLVVGAAGTGKTRHFVTPNILEAVGSMFVCDPKGQLCKQYGRYFEGKGYKVRQIDFVHPERSDGYNPMDYIRNTHDITKLAAVIVDAKESEGTNADPYWDRMTETLISSLIGYLIETRSKDKDFHGILDLLLKSESYDPDSYNKNSELKEMFERHKRLNPRSWAAEKFFQAYAAPQKTYDTIRTTLSAKFCELDTEEIRQMMHRGGFDFRRVAQEKTVVFVTVSDTDRSMDSLVNIFFSQAMNELCSYADDECPEGRLPIPVRFFLDDFATNCRIEEFPRMISSIRSRGLSTILMLQAEAQLRSCYGHDAQTIISNCDTYIYLGGSDIDTAGNIAERCDCPLADVLYMPVGECRIFRRGERPVISRLVEVDKLIKDLDK